MEVEIKNKFVAFAAVCLAIPAMLLAQPDAKKRLAGAWEERVWPVGQPRSPLLSLAIFGGDGSFTTVGGYKALPPIPAVQDVGNDLGPGYGRWAAMSDQEFRLTFYSALSKAGLVNGFERVQDTLILSESGEEYTGRSQVDFFDANWNVVFSTINHVKGKRLETPPILLTEPTGKSQLVGVWEEKAGIGQLRSTLLSLAMFSGEGSFTSAGGYNALPPNPAVQDVANEVSPGYGRWVVTGAREFRLTFYSVMSKAGLASGFERVQGTLVMSESGEEYTGHADVDFFDPNWNVLFHTTSDVTGTRLEIPAGLLAQPAERKGVWEVKARGLGTSEPPLLGLNLIGEDGSFTLDIGSTLSPIPALLAVANERGSSFGRLVQTGDRAFRLTFYTVLLKAGLVKRVPAVRGPTTLIGVGRRVRRACHDRLFGPKLDSGVQHEQ
jgi:hypothetical protein